MPHGRHVILTRHDRKIISSYCVAWQEKNGDLKWIVQSGFHSSIFYKFSQPLFLQLKRTRSSPYAAEANGDLGEQVFECLKEEIHNREQAEKRKGKAFPAVH